MTDKLETKEADAEASGTSEETGESEEVKSEEVKAESSAENAASEDSGASTADGDTTPKSDDWLVPGRFKTLEDLKNSYQNLEVAYSRRGNELHGLKQKMNQEKDSSEETERFTEAVKRNPVQAIKEIARAEAEEAKTEARQIRFESEYHRRMSNKEFAELEPIMANLVQKWGDVIQQAGLANNPQLLDVLFYAARGVKQEQMTKKAEAKGQTKGEAAAFKKAKAQIEGSSGTKGVTKRVFGELSLKEMKKEIDSGNLG